MTFLQHMSDDQVALIGCFVAIVVSFGVMTLTLTVREAIGGERVLDKTGPTTLDISAQKAAPERHRTAA